ncbi:MAG TPA: PEP-CTERM sorting domain-containing protein [Bryobacteraceae bacterium]|nr:PEP-CTERM sorting domain-containing protein [Bryobacteraceae bacterium]
MSILRIGGACAALTFALLGSTAGATPIPIEITGHLGGNIFRYTMTGPGFEYSISTAEGPYVVGLCEKAPCDVLASYPAGVPSVQFANTATFNGVFAPQTGGEILISFPVAGGALQGNLFTATVPISLTAQITGFRGEVASTSRGEVLFSAVVRGSGNATIFGRIFDDGFTVVQGADFTIPGTVEQVPEPVTLTLVGAGLSALALLRKRVTHS